MIPRSFLLILCLLSATSWAAQSRLDMAGLVKLLLAQGYHDIREVELEGDKFEVKTLNRQDLEGASHRRCLHCEINNKRPIRPLLHSSAPAWGAAVSPVSARAGRRPAAGR